MSSEILQAIAGTIYLATITTVGIRLIMLARRNRALPELLLGLSLLVGGTLGAVVEAVGMSGEVVVAPAIAGKLLATGKFFGFIGFTSHMLFIRIVFRQGSAWATGLVCLTLFAMLGAYGAYGASGTFADGVMPLPIFFVEFAARSIGSIWLISESILYYGIMKKRLALGLSEPIVADRFRLWAIAGIAGFGLLATSVPPMIWPRADTMWMQMLIPVFAVCGIISSGAYLLAFFPPAFYRRRVEARLSDASA